MMALYLPSKIFKVLRLVGQAELGGTNYWRSLLSQLLARARGVSVEFLSYETWLFHNAF